MRFKNIFPSSRAALFGPVLLLLPWLVSGREALNGNSWSLASPNGLWRITVVLDDEQRLSYQVWRQDKVALAKSPLGLKTDNQDFARGLTLESMGKIESRREKYQLMAGGVPHVNQPLNRRTLRFSNTNQAVFEIELASSNEGVAFRYRLPGTLPGVRVANAELTGFQLPLNALAWLQPYHAAGPYTPAYEDFYFKVSPGEPPPLSRGPKSVGWSFPALFHLPDAATWVLLTESGTDESYCGCHLLPDSPGGLYRIGFSLVDEGTRGHRNRVGPEPRHELPWTMPWRVIVLGRSAGDIAMATLVTDLAPPSRINDVSWIKPGQSAWAKNWWRR